MKTTQHTVLYRKYRPSTFKEVRGQEHIVETLSRSIENDSVAHAYLFSGSRGTGKTSLARIFARDLKTYEHDIYEIDAASNRGIDDIRELRESVLTLPLQSRFKVYIIDEVHMLTKEAFNALLKTLEEPPAHAIFILATTELHKVPETIISRCQMFRFKQPPLPLLSSFIEEVAEKEKFSIEKGASEVIALSGDGSFRDALGTLEQITTATKGKKITLEDVERMLGVPKRTAISEMLASLHTKNIEMGLSAIRGISDNGGDIELATRILCEHVRHVLLFRFGGEGMVKKVKEYASPEMLGTLDGYAKEKTSGITSQTLATLLKALSEMRYALVKEMPLELAFMELLVSKRE